jgi:hypothetical protein
MMPENKKALLALILENINKPCLYVSELSALTGFSAVNIRMHQNRLNIILEHTPIAGRGQGIKALYPPVDLFEVMALAELCKLDVPLKRSGNHIKTGTGIAYHIANLMYRRLRQKNGEELNDNSDLRYALILFSDDFNGIDIVWSEYSYPAFESPHTDKITWVTVDCEVLLQKAIHFFGENQDVLVR